jgi:hypothetical protein
LFVFYAAVCFFSNRQEQLHPTKDKVDSVYQGNSEDIAPLDKIQIVDMIVSMDSDASHCEQVQLLIAYAKDKDIVNSNGIKRYQSTLVDYAVQWI